MTDIEWRDAFRELFTVIRSVVEPTVNPKRLTPKRYNRYDAYRRRYTARKTRQTIDGKGCTVDGNGLG